MLKMGLGAACAFAALLLGFRACQQRKVNEQRERERERERVHVCPHKNTWSQDTQRTPQTRGHTTHVYTRTHICIHTRTHTHTHSPPLPPPLALTPQQQELGLHTTHTHAHKSVTTHTHTHTHAHTHAHTHTHTHTRTQLKHNQLTPHTRTNNQDFCQKTIFWHVLVSVVVFWVFFRSRGGGGDRSWRSTTTAGRRRAARSRSVLFRCVSTHKHAHKRCFVPCHNRKGG